MESQNIFLASMKFLYNTENIQEKTVDIVSKYKLAFVQLSAWAADSANVHSGIFHSVYKFLIKEHEKILPAKCPASFVHNTFKNTYNTLTCDTELFITKVLGHFVISNLQKPY